MTWVTHTTHDRREPLFAALMLEVTLATLEQSATHKGDLVAHPDKNLGSERHDLLNLLRENICVHAQRT